jgi:uncharacterized pyridoxamine 5'-phosphate oxidase family protein
MLYATILFMNDLLIDILIFNSKLPINRNHFMYEHHANDIFKVIIVDQLTIRTCVLKTVVAYL